jgi:hypothetical protein
VKPSYESVEAAVRTESGYEFLWYAALVFIAIALAFSFYGQQIAQIFI